MVDREVEEVEGNLFVDGKGRLKVVGEEASVRYRNVANDSELVDRKFCESYEHLLATVKCSMEKLGSQDACLKYFKRS